MCTILSQSSLTQMQTLPKAAKIYFQIKDFPNATILSLILAASYILFSDMIRSMLLPLS